MPKPTRHQSREEVQRLRERWDREEEIPLFDTTLTSGINDTVQHLALREDGSARDPREERLHFDAIKQLTEEAQYIRKTMAEMITVTNLKASKRLVEKLQAEANARLDAKLSKSVENIFKLVTVIGAIVAILVSLIGVVIAFKH